MGDERITQFKFEKLMDENLMERVVSLMTEGFMMGSIIGFVKASQEMKQNNKVSPSKGGGAFGPAFYEQQAAKAVRTGAHFAVVCGIFTACTEILLPDSAEDALSSRIMRWEDYSSGFAAGAISGVGGWVFNALTDVALQGSDALRNSLPAAKTNIKQLPKHMLVFGLAGLLYLPARTLIPVVEDLAPASVKRPGAAGSSAPRSETN